MSDAMSPVVSVPASGPSASGPLVVGIDVCLERLDVASSDTDTPAAYANDPAGIRSLIDALCRLRPTLIVTRVHR